MHYRISSLHIYPIKSLGGIRVSESLIEPRGLQYDRRWMLVDENNQFLTQRNIHQFSLFKIDFNENGFSIRHPKELNNVLKIPYKVKEGKEIKVKIWEDIAPAIHANPDYDNWFKSILQFNCKLVYMPDDSKRLVDTNYAYSSEIVNFADGYPLLIIGEESLNELNKKLDNFILMNRFRPNIVFMGGKAHDEDQWQNFEINQVKFKGVKPCGRCIVTTINQENSLLEKEPLKTLATYRKKDNKICFGQNVLTQTIGLISVGDQIKTIDFIQPPFSIYND